MKSPRAFSLVEVVLALGIFAFAIIALFGLISASLQSSRESASDLTLGLMTQTVSSTLKMQGFEAVSKATTGTNFYFNVEGDLIRDTAGKPKTSIDPQDNAFYVCQVTGITNAATRNALMLRGVFSWPQDLPAAKRQTRTVLTSLANYE